MSDKLVFDLAQEVEGTPNVFVRKDWINILDNQNQNYNNNQSVLDTSQLSNSNKYMSYREAYFSIPFLITIAQTAQNQGTYGAADTNYFLSPNAPATSWDYACGLKNWFGQIIHSFTLDYNGTTIIQQTPYVNMWNSFKLMTSLSLNDIHTQGCQIGFYPDDPTSWTLIDSTQATLAAATGTSYPNGQGVCNNTNLMNESQPVATIYNRFNSGLGNIGFVKRQKYINFDLEALPTSQQGAIVSTTAYGSMLQGGSLATPLSGSTTTQQVWKSFISKKRSQSGVAPVAGAIASGAGALFQISVVASVYLKHVHSFFNMCPLLKGVFMKMTMNLNNCSSTVQTLTFYNATVPTQTGIVCSGVQNSVGGVNPLMISSVFSGVYASSAVAGSGFAAPTVLNAQGGASTCSAGTAGAQATVANTLVYNISVGSTCLDSSMSSQVGSSIGTLSKSIYLYIPAYTFNPVFEQAYLSSPVKQIKYTDIYQYQVLNVGTGVNFNNLLTNGIANIKSVLVLPFFSTNFSNTTVPITCGGAATVNVNTNTSFLTGVPVWQSPFDPAGTGPTSPCCWFSNFNIQVSGQNAIYNVERYNFEQWNNQLYGQNAVNGGLTDGLTSGLIDRQAFDMNYCYYYVNVERMLPVEQSVPKSIQILGQNYSSRAIDLYCFIEYGVDISIDALTGARV